jgi:ABC-type sugar transport system ATPase subunit
VELTEPLGNMTIIHFTVDSIPIKTMMIGSHFAKKDEKKYLTFDKMKIHAFDKKTEKAIF